MCNAVFGSVQRCTHTFHKTQLKPLLLNGAVTGESNDHRVRRPWGHEFRRLLTASSRKQVRLRRALFEELELVIGALFVGFELKNEMNTALIRFRVNAEVSKGIHTSDSWITVPSTGQALESKLRCLAKICFSHFILL